MAPSNADPGSPDPSRQDGTAVEAKRNLKACDVCRSRKVRCVYDTSHRRCQGCVFLGVDCTYQRPRRKRGPPNKHAQRYQKSAAATPSPSDHPTPPSRDNGPPTSAAFLQSPGLSGHVVTSPSDAAGPPLSAFASEEVISRLLTDWFDKIHPVAPILLRRRFLRRLHSGEADANPIFCALVVSVCAATRATLPRGNHDPMTVEQCVEFLDRHGLLMNRFSQRSFSLDWCIAMYNMGTVISAVSESGLSDMRSYHALSEAASGVRYLAYYCLHELDDAEQQLLRRLFWLLFAASCSADIFGRLSVNVLPQDRIEAFPRPLPLSDDQMEPPSSEHHGAGWHGDDTSYVPGLNSLSDLFLIWQEIQQTPKDNDPKSMINKFLDKIQCVINNLPPELRWRGGLSRPPTVTQGHDVQIANLFVTSLDIRSNVLQKFGPTDTSALEHQRIVDDLLEILYHLPQAVFDANGSSLVPKIRDIGAAYMEQTQLGGGTATVESEVARDRLQRLLRKLDDLDCWVGIGVVDSPPARMGTK